MAPAPAIEMQISALTVNIIDWITVHSGAILVATLIGASLVALLILVQQFGKHLLASPNAWRAVIGHGLAAMRIWFMVALAAQLVATYAHAPAEAARTIGFIFVIAATLQVALFLRGLILGAIDVRAQQADPDRTLDSAMNIIKLAVSIGLFAMATILILTNLGVDATGLLAGLGIGGIAIGLAAQGIFSDLFAGLSILFDQPFRRGDTIRFDGTIGTVEAIGVKTTRIRALSGEEVIVSNTNLLSKEIRNFEGSAYRRITQMIGLIYQTPVALCATLPQRLNDTVSAVDHARFVRAGLSTFGASSLDFELVYDIASDDPDVILGVKAAINIAILTEFESAGISFAYPTQTTFTAAPSGEMVMPYAIVKSGVT